MSEPPRIGDLIEKYRARWVILGTANGYTVQRRAKGARGGGVGVMKHAKDVEELAQVLADADTEDR